MGRRKNEKLLDILIRLPWWVGVIGSIVILVFRLIWLNWAESNSGMFAPLMRQVSYIFYFLAFVFAIGGFASFVRQWWNGRNLDKLDLYEVPAAPSRKFFTTSPPAESSSIQDFDWRAFESLVQEIFRRQGFIAVETPSGPDGGFDIALRKNGKRYLVQCKHWKSRQVGVAPVRELWGVIAASNAAGGFFVTSGRFTVEAKDFASQVKLKLIDGPNLKKLARQVQRGTQQKPSNDPKIEPVVNEFPSCPKCGREMVRRTAKRGSNIGRKFWGCSSYPRCRGVVSYS